MGTTDADKIAPEEKIPQEDQAQPEVAGDAPAEIRDLEFLYDIPLQISVEVGRSKLMVKELLQMRDGHVIELDKLAGEPLDLYVNSRLIGRGEAVIVNDKFGLRLTDVVSPAERLEKLG